MKSSTVCFSVLLLMITVLLLLLLLDCFVEECFLFVLCCVDVGILKILNNKHDFGTAEETLKLLKSYHKGTRMNCWETFYMQLLHQHRTLINEQQVSDIIPLHEIADTS